MTTAIDPPSTASASRSTSASMSASDRRPPPDGVDHPKPSSTPEGSSTPSDESVPPAAGRWALLPWVMAAVGLVGTLGFALAWQGERGGDDAIGSTATAETGATAELLEAARSFSEALTNFDGATIDRDFDRITGQAAGEFRSQVDQFFSTEIRTQLKEAQAASRGEIRSAFVQTAEADRGTVFVVVDQTIANNRSPLPQADTLRMELGMVLNEGEWLVERVAVLTAPSGGSTLTPGG